MGFKDAKRQAISALIEGSYRNESRDGLIDIKNLLATNAVSVKFVEELLRQSRGSEHSASPHHQIAGVEVNVITTRGWYIKFYFIEPNIWFISVHPESMP